jgi:hypothetical protein
MMALIELKGTEQQNIDKIAELLRKQVLKDLKNPKRSYFIRRVALKIVANCPRKDYLCECAKIAKWVYHNFRYVKDPHGIELFISPYLLLKRGLKDKSLAQADCETLSQLVAALAMSIGHRAKLVLVDSTGDGNFNHAIALIKPRKHGWYWADPTISPYLMRRLPYRIYKKKEIPLEVR